MYKSNYIFVWSLCIRRTRLPRQSSTTTTAGFGSCQCLNMCKIHSHVAHRLAQRTLFPLQCPYQQSAALLHFHPTTFEHFPVLEDRTQQLNSWEFWGVWHLDWQQRTSKLFPASLPTPCQAVALIKGGPNYAHFYAIRGISFHRHGLFFFFCVTDKTFRKMHHSLWSQFGRRCCGKTSTVGTQLLFVFAQT